MNTRSLFSRLFHSPIPRFAAVMLVALFALASSSPAFGGEIHDAARDGDLAKVKALLKDNPDLVFSKDNQGLTPLHLAAGYGRKDVAELLLADKAEVNAKDNQGLTPLHLAAVFGHKDVAEFLLVSKAEVNAKVNNGDTPLHVAAASGHEGVAELLLADKAEVNAKDAEGDTPLFLAAFRGHKDVVEVLLASKADVNAKDAEGDTPLQMAAIMGHSDVMALLGQHGGQVYVSTPMLSTLAASASVAIQSSQLRSELAVPTGGGQLVGDHLVPAVEIRRPQAGHVYLSLLLQITIKSPAKPFDLTLTDITLRPEISGAQSYRPFFWEKRVGLFMSLHSYKLTIDDGTVLGLTVEVPTNLDAAKLVLAFGDHSVGSLGALGLKSSR